MCSGSPFEKLRWTVAFSSSKKGRGVVVPLAVLSVSDVGDNIESRDSLLKKVKECGLLKFARDPMLVVDVGRSHSARSPRDGVSSAILQDS
jgi:hypothetical protein